MVTQFEEGETYRNSKLPQDIMVLGVASETPTSVTLAILWVDRESTESTKHGSYTVMKADFGDWSEVEYD